MEHIQAKARGTFTECKVSRLCVSFAIYNGIEAQTIGARLKDP